MKKIQDKYIDNAYKIIGLNVKKSKGVKGLDTA